MHDPEHYNHREEMLFTDNPTVYWKARRFKLLDCGRCAPHRNENQHGRIPRYDRYKSVRKGRCAGKLEPPERQKQSYRPTRVVRVGAPAKMWETDIDRNRSWYVSPEAVEAMAESGVKNGMTYYSEYASKQRAQKKKKPPV